MYAILAADLGSRTHDITRTRRYTCVCTPNGATAGCRGSRVIIYANALRRARVLYCCALGTGSAREKYVSDSARVKQWVLTGLR